MSTREERVKRVEDTGVVDDHDTQELAIETFAGMPKVDTNDVKRRTLALHMEVWKHCRDNLRKHEAQGMPTYLDWKIKVVSINNIKEKYPTNLTQEQVERDAQGMVEHIGRMVNRSVKSTGMGAWAVIVVLIAKRYYEKESEVDEIITVFRKEIMKVPHAKCTPEMFWSSLAAALKHGPYRKGSTPSESAQSTDYHEIRGTSK